VHWRSLGGGIRLEGGTAPVPPRVPAEDRPKPEPVAPAPPPPVVSEPVEAYAPGPAPDEADRPERPVGRRKYQYRSQPGPEAQRIDVSPDQVAELVEPARTAASPDVLVSVIHSLIAVLGPLSQRHDPADFPPPLADALRAFWAAIAESRQRLTPPHDLRRVRFGYRRENGGAVPDKVEQAVLDYVRRRERDGASIAHIAEELTLLQVPARGDRWHRAQLDRLVHEQDEERENTPAETRTPVPDANTPEPEPEPDRPPAEASTPSPAVVRRKAGAPAPKPGGIEWRVRGEWRAVEKDLRTCQSAGRLDVGFSRNADLKTRSTHHVTVLFVASDPAEARRLEDKLMSQFPDANLVEQAPDDDAPGTVVMYTLT
jgi:hypothetical protein